MFPIPFNFPFITKTGKRTTIGDAISAGGGGGSYTLPTASAETKGGVKVGAGLTMDGEVLKNTNPTAYTLPVAGAETLGGIKIGTGLSINENGVVSAAGGGGGATITSETIEVSKSGTANSYIRVAFTPPTNKTPIACTVTEKTGYTQRYWLVSLSKDNNNAWGANFAYIDSQAASGSISLNVDLTVYYI